MGIFFFPVSVSSSGHFQKITEWDFSPALTEPPNSLTCLNVKNRFCSYSRALRSQTLIPLYAFPLTKFRGKPELLQGRCQGIVPFSRCSIIRSVTRANTSRVLVVGSIKCDFVKEYFP